MDLAILLDARRDGEKAPGLYVRPFGDSSLLEMALEKLALLDAPCRKYVAVAERELEPLVRRHAGLTILRRRPSAGSSGPIAAAWSHIAALPESHFLRINPAWPLIDGETWWRAAERFLANGSGGLVTAQRQEGRFHVDDGNDGRGRVLRGTVFSECDAFEVVAKGAIFDEGALFPRQGPPVAVFELPKSARLGIRDLDDLAAVEAIWSRTRLSQPV